MVCLLCFENGDYIPLSSDESVHSKVASILFKYFRFMFETEPDSGEICRKCWMKVEMFHTFYQRIKEIQTTVIKVQPIVVENLSFFTKNESNADPTSNDGVCKVNIPIESIDEKYDHHFDDNYWRDESDAFPSECSNMEIKSKNRM